jgi:hypothetical protein
MIRQLLAAVVALAPLPALAQNENLSFSQRVAIYRACKPDLDRRCPDAGRDSTRVSSCLRTHQAQLSQGCVAAVRQTGAR